MNKKAALGSFFVAKVKDNTVKWDLPEESDTIILLKHRYRNQWKITKGKRKKAGKESGKKVRNYRNSKKLIFLKKPASFYKEIYKEEEWWKKYY